MRQSAVVTLLVLLSFALGGCQSAPFARELEDTMLVQTLGIDWDGSEVTLTAAADPGTGSQTAGESLLSASGTNLERAEAALKGSGEEYVALTHVAQVVIGADTDVPSVLEAVLREPALGQGASVWLAQSGTAQALMEGANGGAKRLSSIALNGGVELVTVLEALMYLEEKGRVTVPVLALDGGKLVSPAAKVIGGENIGA